MEIKENRSYAVFTLGERLTAEQRDFFEEYGFLHFKNFIDKETVEKIIRASEEVERQWIEDDVKQVYGVPVKYGHNLDGSKIIQRFAFLSLYSSYIKKFLQDERFKALFQLLGTEGRIGEYENDGIVFNHYIHSDESEFTKMGWHTDSVRDLFYGKKINPMLNVGVHLDNYSEGGGGLCVLPGTHKQNVAGILFRKRYIVDTNPDKDELNIKPNAGDLTVHEGRMWHRVAPCSLTGEDSRRRVMYIPFVSGKYKPKRLKSKPRIYQRFLSMVR